MEWFGLRRSGGLWPVVGLLSLVVLFGSSELCWGLNDGDGAFVSLANLVGGEEEISDPCLSAGVRGEGGNLNSRITTARRLLQTLKKAPNSEDQPNKTKRFPSVNLSPFAAPPSNRKRFTRPSSSTSPAPTPPKPSNPSITRQSSPSPALAPKRNNTGKAEHSPLSRPTPDPISSPKSKKSHLLIYMMIAIGAGCVVFLAIVFLICRAKKVGTVKPWVTGLSGPLQRAFVTGVPALKRSEIVSACEDFSNIIGTLADCTIYKGTLSSGVEIAVTSPELKSAKDWSKYSEAQFRKKIATLSKINHKNFVNLLGYCEEEKPIFTRMMLFEYAPNGTLHDHLHIKEAEELDWAARLRIAMGIAYCLEHLEQFNLPIVLKNLDSTSIYLTDDCAAKISDFRLWSETKACDIESRTSEPSDLVKETLDKEDNVYNYGLILLEILTGRLPYTEEYGELIEWASKYLKGESPLKDMIDPALNNVGTDDAARICSVIKSCLMTSPSERPRMGDVAAQLREIIAVSPEGAAPRLSPLWWAELEIITTEA